MKTVRLKSGILHVVTPLGIVNIRVGLNDLSGRNVESIEVIPYNYAGEPAVYRRGPANVRLVQSKTQKGGR